MSLKLIIFILLLFYLSIGLGAVPMIWLLNRVYPVHKAVSFLFTLVVFSYPAVCYGLEAVAVLVVAIFSATLVFAIYFAANYEYMRNRWAPSMGDYYMKNYLFTYYYFLGILLCLNHFTIGGDFMKNYLFTYFLIFAILVWLNL